MMWKFDAYKDNIAVIDEHDSYSYTWLKDECDKVYACINERCLVFSLCSNTIGSLIGYTSFINNKVVPLLLDSQIDIGILDGLMKIYRPKYLWIPVQMASDFKYERLHAYTTHNYALIKTQYTEGYPLHDDLALLLTTSGSTGSPKLVRQSYKNIKSNTESIVKYLGINESECAITTLPMSYTYGLSIINTHLYMGASIILTQKTLVQKEFWQQLKDYGVTSLSGVPYTYEMLNKLNFYKMDLPCLRTLTQAGGKLPFDLHKKFAEYGKQFVVMYGQTEATARMSYLPWEKTLEKCGSIGIAIPGGEFSLVDGELVYEGDNVTLGYAECGEDLAKGDENNGKLFTGDMAKVDEDGYYYITGRKKRFVKMFGNRISLDEVEEIVKITFDLDCACTGDDTSIDVFITKANSDVLGHLSSMLKMPTYKFNLFVIGEMPRNEAGKVLYHELGVF